MLVLTVAASAAAATGDVLVFVAGFGEAVAKSSVLRYNVRVVYE